MTGRFKALMFAVSVCIGLLLSAPSTTAQPALRCPGGTVADPKTGICWSSNQYNHGSGNRPCLPGRLGLCLGALQNSPTPGAALQPATPGGPAPRPSWP